METNIKSQPRFRTLKSCQEILDNPTSSKVDKQTATTRITEIKKWLETKNGRDSRTRPIEPDFDVSEHQKDIDQEAELIAIAYSITVKRYPKMSQTDNTFGQIVNATANRILEIRKTDAICKIAQRLEDPSN